MAKRKTASIAPTQAIVAAPLPQRIEVLDNTGRIIEAIIKVASDPKADVGKMERLVQMHAEMQARAAKIAFDEALAQMLPELPVIARNGLIEIREKDAKGERTGRLVQKTPYALWEDIAIAIRPILHKYGFSLTFRTPVDPNGRVSVTGILARGGHREETTLSYQHDSSGSKNAAQAINSSTSYGMRKTACLLLNIITRGEDDDAKKSEGLEPITKKQVEELLKLAKEAGADLPRFYAMMNVTDMTGITKLRLNEAKQQLNRKLRDKKAREEKAKAESDFPGDRP